MYIILLVKTPFMAKNTNVLNFFRLFLNKNNVYLLLYSEKCGVFRECGGKARLNPVITIDASF